MFKESYRPLSVFIANAQFLKRVAKPYNSIPKMFRGRSPQAHHIEVMAFYETLTDTKSPQA